MRTLTLAAVAVAALGSSAFAIDIPVNSGTFETSPPANDAFGLISGWNNVVPGSGDIPVPGDGRHTGVFTSYAGFTGTNGSRMAFLSNQGTGQVLMRSALPTQVFRMYYVQFDYMFLTDMATTTSVAAAPLRKPRRFSAALGTRMSLSVIVFEASRMLVP